MARRSKPRGPKQVEALSHEEAKRRNIATAELQSLAEQMEEQDPLPPQHYPRSRPLATGATRDRDADLDPQIVWNGARIRLSPAQVRQLQETGEVEIGDAQLVWRGKDRQDWSDLVVHAPQLYIQEKVHPKAIIDDLVRRSKQAAEAGSDAPDLFADFNGVDPEAKTEFYQHDQHWSNRMILGDSLHVMASLASREGLKGKVQCIYIDPPYGIKFNSNWQVSTASRDVKDGKREDISREPEQVKAFRDTWKDGIHSYLTYLRDRLTVARELLTESGSIFVQIGDENVHRVRALMDEVFGEENFVSQINYSTTTGRPDALISTEHDSVLFYSRDRKAVKFRRLLTEKDAAEIKSYRYRIDSSMTQVGNVTQQEKAVGIELGDDRLAQLSFAVSQDPGRPEDRRFRFRGREYDCGQARHWKTTNPRGLTALARASRLYPLASQLNYIRLFRDNLYRPFNNIWMDTGSAGYSNSDPKRYVVQTDTAVVQRCLLMATDPGDLVLDPTGGSGTTAYVAEQWGRRWITIDTSRVALALARIRIMAARYPYYLLADTPEGRMKEGEVTGKPPPSAPTHGDIRQGFVYERAPHITLKSIANNAEIDVIWEDYQATLEPIREKLNQRLGRNEPWEEWEIPRFAGDPWPAEAAKALEVARDPEQSEKKRQQALDGINLNLGRLLTFDELPEEPFDPWDDEEAMRLHGEWWEQRIARQREIDDSIARAADVELLYDRPYVDTTRVRVAGPFTVESLSPHRVVPADEEELSDALAADEGKRRRAKLATPPTDFAEVILENLRAAGVQQKDKGDAIHFTSLQGWPGEYIGAEGTFQEGNPEEAGSAAGATGNAKERRAAVFIGPEFGTVSRLDIVAAAREASEARFDVLIACAFNYDAHASELTRLGPLPILKAKINPDLHMADELKNTGKGNLFVVFGEPDIAIADLGDGQVTVQVKGIDVFDPNTGDIRSNDTDGIAAWFIDTDYDEESFFVRHAYFLGANDPYKALKTSLKAEIDPDAWATLYRDTSRPFPRPESGWIAVKVINHFGDEVMKVFGV